MFAPTFTRQTHFVARRTLARRLHGLSGVGPKQGFQEALAHIEAHGYEKGGVWEQGIVWGDLDSFRHVNNTRYVRFFESGRMKWVEHIATEVGGEARYKAMLAGQGISLILKSINVKFRRPVTYPDTLLIAHKVHNVQPSRFHLDAIAYSYAQRTVVCQSDEVIVWYDYDHLTKCDAPADMARALAQRCAT